MLIDNSNFKLSIIIPCYNEIKTIEELIKRVKNSSVASKEIIIDDFSTDGTRDYLYSLEDKCIKLIFNSSNQGKEHLFPKELKLQPVIFQLFRMQI